MAESILRLNQVTISGKIVDCGAVRYTPSGIMIVEFKLHHVSSQEEANIQRAVEFELSAIAMTEMAKKITHIKPNTHIELSGFITKKSRLSNQLILHVLNVKYPPQKTAQHTS